MAIRDTTYYGWENIAVLRDLLGQEGLTIVGNTTALDVQVSSFGAIYFSFHVQVNKPNRQPIWSGAQWVLGLYKSVNNGQTWEQIYFEVSSNLNYKAGAIAIDSSNNVYFSTPTDILKSAGGGISGSFSTVDANGVMLQMAVGPGDDIYAVGVESQSGGWLARRSTTGLSGSFSDVDRYSNTAAKTYGVDIVPHPTTPGTNDVIYLVGTNYGPTGDDWCLRSSAGGASGSFSTLDAVPSAAGISYAVAAKYSPGPGVFVVGQHFSSEAWVIRGSSTGASGSFSNYDWQTGGANDPNHARGVAINPRDYSVYVNGWLNANRSDAGTEFHSWFLRRSADGSSGSFSTIEKLETDVNLNFEGERLRIDHKGYIYNYGESEINAGASQGAVLRRGRRTPNSASIGPRMFATSVGYVKTEITGNLNNPAADVVEEFKLNNITEFPHAGGVWQMRNLVLGTQDSGQVGSGDEYILQVNHIGSVVKVFWPKQKDQGKAVKAYGSSGQKVGKLLTVFEPGDNFDVTEYDHAALYCSLLKQTSGTLDTVEIRVERRPLKDVGFGIDQSIEYKTSGSYTVGELTDIHYKKQIDYGDLSIREINFPIDIPLVNTKELRVSVRHINGQGEENKNFIIWGRLIKSDEET